LEDVNDNVPSLYPTLAKVCDDAKDLRVVVLGASDKDLHPNTDPFKFELSKQSGPEKLWRITKLNSKSVTSFLMHLVLPPLHPSTLTLSLPAVSIQEQLCMEVLQAGPIAAALHCAGCDQSSCLVGQQSVCIFSEI